MAGVSAGYVLFAIARGYTVYCLGAAVMGISYGIGGMYLASTLMPKWFKSYVSAAVGICAAGTGVNSIIAPPIITAAIARWGLPAACWLEAAFILLIALIVFSMMRDRPSDFGLSPYETSQSKPDGKKQKLHLLRMATKQEQFMMIIAVTLMHGSIAAAYYHFSLLFTTLGFSNMQIARFLSISGITLTFGKFICGLMADIWGTKRVGYICFITTVSAFVLCIFPNGRFPQICFAMALYGFGSSISTVGISIYSQVISRADDYSDVLCKMQISCQIGQLAFSILPGVLYDWSGSYHFTYVMFTLLLILTTSVIQFLMHRLQREI